MTYDGFIFPILFWDNGHVLLRSQYRTNVAHSVDLHQGICSCENSQIDKNAECKHLKFLRWAQGELRKRFGYDDGSRKIASPPEPNQQQEPSTVLRPAIVAPTGGNEVPGGDGSDPGGGWNDGGHSFSKW